MLLLGSIFLAFAVGVWKIGQAFGGKGNFEESMIVSIFFQAILLPFQVVQLTLAVLVPGLGGLFGIALLFWDMLTIGRTETRAIRVLSPAPG